MFFKSLFDLLKVEFRLSQKFLSVKFAKVDSFESRWQPRDRSKSKDSRSSSMIGFMATEVMTLVTLDVALYLLLKLNLGNAEQIDHKQKNLKKVKKLKLKKYFDHSLNVSDLKFI